MGYTIDYHAMYSDKQTKHEAAVNDCHRYLTQLADDALYTIAMQCKEYRQFSFPCHFAGIQGYPAVAYWNDMKQTCIDMTQ